MSYTLSLKASLNLSVFFGALVISLFLLPAYGSAAQLDNKAQLDKESARCLMCHDTAIDPENPFRVCHNAGCDHTLGLDYVSVSAGNPGFTPAAELSPSVKLVGVDSNRIGCTTCHVPYLKANHKELSLRRAKEVIDPMLSTSNSGSGLCLECHRK